MHAVLCDLDGVVWLAHRPIPGSVEAIARLRRAGHRVLFVTNNSSARVEEQEAALGAIGIPAGGDILTSAMAAAQLVQPGERVLACAGAGVVQALLARGADVVDGAGNDVDAVVVGWHRTFDYAGLTAAVTAVLGGGRLIGTNEDATYPTPDGPIPGGGALLAAVVAASGARPTIAGKPHRPMADLVRSTIGDAAAGAAVMIGDRPSTDGLFARTLGCRYGHVRSGVTPGAPVELQADLDAPDLAALADAILAQA